MKFINWKDQEQHIFIISADLGQSQDFTAISIIERIARLPPHQKTYSIDDFIKEYHLRHIERPERGTPYTTISERLYELKNSKEFYPFDSIVVVDYTGVGRPVYDHMIKSSFSKDSRDLYGIQITGGNAVNHDANNHWIYNVPKRDLISALQIVFQNGDLKIAKGIPLGDILVKELTNFRVKISVSGHDTYEAWREKDHDDIVLSAAMGIWLGNTRAGIQW